MEARKLYPPKTFSVITHYKGSYWHKTIRDRRRDKILGRMKNSRLLNRKAKMLWQLGDYLYGKPIQRDWRA